MDATGRSVPVAVPAYLVCPGCHYGASGLAVHAGALGVRCAGGLLALCCQLLCVVCPVLLV